MARTDTDGRTPEVDSTHFRETLGRFPTGVVIVTAIDGDEPLGMVVGSFTSVSLDPPLVAYLPARTSTSYTRLAQRKHFCVNVLSVEQEGLCRQFSMRGVDKYAGVDWSPAPSGSPILAGAVAWIDCEVDDVVSAGDHDIVIGRVGALGAGAEATPMLFLRGGYGGFDARSLVAGYSTDLRKQLQVADLARAPMEQLAAELNLACYAQAVVDGDLVVVAGAGAGGTSVRTHIGHRMPFTPPYGALFCDEDDIDAAARRWSRYARKPASDDERRTYVDMLATVRTRGWSIGLKAPHHDRVWDQVTQYSRVAPTPDLDRKIGAVVDELTPYYEPNEVDAENNVRILAAPVVDDAGRTVLVLALFGMPNGVSPDQVESWARTLVSVADEVSRRLAASSISTELAPMTGAQK
ncbi:flavin reductase [Rhodococcus sovatensis]|uniref:Flavin reductase n=1 Tax=Rhodococcus sovatensis TaxID=1805840 RepID=A0ABZ2PLF7_9NOCA